MTCSQPLEPMSKPDGLYTNVIKLFRKRVPAADALRT
jgi:hypothetical protein